MNGAVSCAGRVAIVTGAGRGLGQAYALALADAGAMVVVNNDLRTDSAESSAGGSAAERVAAQIVAAGGQAVASTADVADWDSAGDLIELAVSTFGGLDVLVNNAGNLRDRMIVNLTADDWDAVIRVHLRGTMAPLHWAARHWRSRAKAGEPASGRVINTTSATGLYGKQGQVNYGAAKAGIASLTITAAAELARYGATVNAISPVARTRMTDSALPARPELRAGGNAADRWRPELIAPLVVWLASAASAGVTGRVFEMTGEMVSVAEGWRRGPAASSGRGWTTDTLGPTVRELVLAATPNSDLQGIPGGQAASATNNGGR